MAFLSLCLQYSHVLYGHSISMQHSENTSLDAIQEMLQNHRRSELKESEGSQRVNIRRSCLLATV